MGSLQKRSSGAKHTEIESTSEEKVMNRLNLSLSSLVFLSLFAVGCSDDPSEEVESGRYALASLVFDDQGSNMYLALLDDLEQDVDLSKTREYPGGSDLWVRGGDAFVTNAEESTVTQHAIEDGQLIEGETISFKDWGAGVSFWSIAFAGDKALLEYDQGYVMWDPKAMEITGEIEMPEVEVPEGFHLVAGYADRAAVERDGKLYHAYYVVTDDSDFEYVNYSYIAVIDVKSEKLVDWIEAPCPGLDFGSQDEEGNLYFSSWVFAAGAATVLDQPETCVVQLPAGSNKPKRWATFSDLTDGLEGAALYATQDGQGMFVALDPEHATGDVTDPDNVTHNNNWRVWSFNFETKEATRVDGLPWNSGGLYWSKLGDDIGLLLPKNDYSATTLYLFEDADPTRSKKALEVDGWATRIFALD